MDMNSDQLESLKSSQADIINNHRSSMRLKGLRILDIITSIILIIIGLWVFSVSLSKTGDTKTLLIIVAFLFILGELSTLFFRFFGKKILRKYIHKYANMTKHEKKKSLLELKIKIKKVLFINILLGMLLLSMGVIGYLNDIISWPILFLFTLIIEMMIIWPLISIFSIKKNFKIPFR